MRCTSPNTTHKHTDNSLVHAAKGAFEKKESIDLNNFNVKRAIGL